MAGLFLNVAEHVEIWLNRLVVRAPIRFQEQNLNFPQHRLSCQYGLL